MFGVWVELCVLLLWDGGGMGVSAFVFRWRWAGDSVMEFVELSWFRFLGVWFLFHLVGVPSSEKFAYYLFLKCFLGRDVFELVLRVFGLLSAIVVFCSG